MGKMKEYEMSYKDELLGIYSDMYKDINGFRPRGMGVEELSVEELKAEMQRMSDEIGEIVEREQAYTKTYFENVEAAKADPNGFVWKGDYDYEANTTTQAYIVPPPPPNNALARALAEVEL